MKPIEGIQDDDEQLGYGTPSMWIHLQFRDGRLVNHNPNYYPMEFNSLAQ